MFAPGANYKTSLSGTAWNNYSKYFDSYVGRKIENFRRHGFKKNINKYFKNGEHNVKDCRSQTFNMWSGCLRDLFFLSNFDYFNVNSFECMVRSYMTNYSLFVRHNCNLDLYKSIYESIHAVFTNIRFHRKYRDDMIKQFSLMLFSKDTYKFAITVKEVIQKLSRLEQKKFFYYFLKIKPVTMERWLSYFGLVGFYMKAVGKIAGYVGDRTKSFIIRHGKYSRSIRSYRYSYYQTTAFTKPGAIGITILLLYK